MVSNQWKFILGASLFVLFINDLPDVIDSNCSSSILIVCQIGVTGTKLFSNTPSQPRGLNEKLWWKICVIDKITRKAYKLIGFIFRSCQYFVNKKVPSYVHVADWSVAVRFNHPTLHDKTNWKEFKRDSRDSFSSNQIYERTKISV